MSVKAYSFLWLIGFATAFFIINVLFIFVDMNSSAYDFHLGAFLKNAVLHLAEFRHIYISQVGTITESVETNLFRTFGKFNEIQFGTIGEGVPANFFKGC